MSATRTESLEEDNRQLAGERDRLREVNAELVAALREMLREYEPAGDFFLPDGEPDALVLARAALAKAEAR